jgi:hypothetical protein
MTAAGAFWVAGAALPPIVEGHYNIKIVMS